MTTALSSETEATARSSTPAMPQLYAPGWIDRLNGWLRSLPVPAWVVLIAAWLVMFGVHVLLSWLGQPGPAGISPIVGVTVTGPGWWILILALVLDSSARQMMHRMRPAIRVSDMEYARLEYEALTAPAGASLVASLCALPLAPLTTLPYIGLPQSLTPVLVVDSLALCLTWAVVGCVMYHIFHSIMVVTRVQAQYAEVDLFQPGPLYAVSTWTPQIVTYITGFWLLFTILGGQRAFSLNLPLALSLRGAWMGVATLIFVLPLLGVHHRLQDEKDRLLADNGRQLRQMIDQMHRSAEAGDLGRVKDLDAALTSLTREREFLSTISTWPWRLGALRLATTAILAPLVLTVLQELARRWLPH